MDMSNTTVEVQYRLLFIQKSKCRYFKMAKCVGLSNCPYEVTQNMLCNISTKVCFWSLSLTCGQIGHCCKFGFTKAFANYYFQNKY